MLPILASTIVMNTCLAQLQTFSVQQGNAMNLKLGSFTVPTSSIPVIPLIFVCTLIPIYELFSQNLCYTLTVPFLFIYLFSFDELEELEDISDELEHISDELEDISHDAYEKTLEKFKDPDWREMFMAI
ncbi:POT family protein [Medicago truncatula]|uniref:POT family protein n=1 Tax=Medicago truncatula TaxID=3880 RepID=G7KWF5_MEDTR|nr:POT family protein [Medicago truncatula]